MPVVVIFQPMGRRIAVERNDTIWTAAKQAGVPLASICGGQGTCGKCRVRILEGGVSPVSAVEAEFLAPEELTGGNRLACEVRILEKIVVETPLIREDRQSKLTLLDSGKELVVSPGLVKVAVQAPRSSLADPRSDAARLRDTLVGLDYSPPRFGPVELQTLPMVLREGDFRLTCVFNEERFIALEPGDTTTDFFGLAVDFGTTTVAAYLVHLRTGMRLKAAATSNRQTIFGDDVMSRLSYAMSGGASRLRQTAREVLNELIFMVCESAGVSPMAVYAMTITGNTSMLHFLAGWPTTYLGVAPYVAATSDQVQLTATELGVDIHPQAVIWLLPGTGAFAGADCVSAALASGMANTDEITLLIDFGTNAEIVIGSRAGISACATAAGPAFEGARIRHGMRAARGAIDKVWFKDGVVYVRTIGHAKPVGLAGTGLVSAVAALRQAGMLDKRGLFCHQKRLSSEWWLPGPKGSELVLAPASSSRAAITLSQADVGEFQLAKAAVRAGIQILQQKLGLGDADLKRVLLAGAFGNFIEAGDALKAGLLPYIPVEQVHNVGNAAGAGAMEALLSQTQRQQGCKLTDRIHYVELSAEPDFNRLFAKSLLFSQET